MARKKTKPQVGSGAAYGERKQSEELAEATAPEGGLEPAQPSSGSLAAIPRVGPDGIFGPTTRPEMPLTTPLPQAREPEDPRLRMRVMLERAYRDTGAPHIMDMIRSL